MHPVWWRWFVALRDVVSALPPVNLALGTISISGGTGSPAVAVTSVGPNQVTATLGSAVTFTISGGVGGQQIVFALSYVTGAFAATFSTGFKSTGTLTTVAGKIVTVTFCYDGTTWNEVARQSTGV